jgi:hypothetical protein
MKKAILLLLLPFSMHVSAQANEDGKESDKPERGFKKEKLFTGGSANLGLSNYYTSLGISPQFGYSLTNWADAGITLNVNYNSQRDFRVYGDKLRQTVYGPGAFVRLFPVKFLFATAVYEFNMIHENYIAGPNSAYVGYKDRFNANSLLLGGGYAGGRERGNNSYYFLSVAWDILGDKNSPYTDGLNRSLPVIRAGYNIGLFQGKSRSMSSQGNKAGYYY